MYRIPRNDLLSALRRLVPRELHPDDDCRWAAVAVVMAPLPRDDWELLFIQRATAEQDPWSGQMAFPGGRVDPEDADTRAAAVRETLEEVGLDLQAVGQYVGRIHDLQAVARGNIVPMIIRPHLFVLENHPMLLPNHEVETTVWIPLSSLLSGEGRGTTRWHRGDQVRTMPCIRFESYTIWGLTHFMLEELLEHLRACIVEER